MLQDPNLSARAPAPYPVAPARPAPDAPLPAAAPPPGHAGPAKFDQPNPLRDQLLILYQLPVSATDADITAAAAAVLNENASERARREQEAADELVIQKKTDIGLTRDQAVATIERQRKYNARVKEEQAARRPRLIEIIKSCPGHPREARQLAGQEFHGLDSGEFNAVLKDLQTQTAAA